MVRRGVWIALASAMMSGVGLPAIAQGEPQEQAQSPRVVRFDIPPQDLDTAMTRLADQAGIRLLGASGDLAGKRTAGLSGSYTIAQALNTLLAGSGVNWRFSEANTVVLERQASASGAVQLDPVRVQAGVPPQAVIDNLPPAYAGGQVAKGAQVGFLGERDFMDTPFNQSSLHLDADPEPAGAQHCRRRRQRSFGAQRLAGRRLLHGPDDPWLLLQQQRHVLRRPLRHRTDAPGGA